MQLFPPDIVETQRAFLKPTPPTRIIRKSVWPALHQELSWRIQIRQTARNSRYRKYGGEAAEEWLLGYTPVELRENYAAELDAMLDAWDECSPPPPAPPDDDLDDEEALSQKSTTRASPRQRPQPAADTPSDANRESLAPRGATPTRARGRKRLRSVESGPSRTSGGIQTKRRLIQPDREITPVEIPAG